MRRKFFIIISAFLLSSCSNFFSETIVFNKNLQVSPIAKNSNNKENYDAKFDKDLYKKPSNPEDILKSANNYRLAKSCHKAEKLYQKIIGINLNRDSVIEAKEGMGLCLLTDGKDKEAINLFKEVIEIDATRWKSINALAIIFTMNKKYKEALNYYEIALELSDQSDIVANNIALTYALQNEPKSGIRLLENINKKLPENSDSKKRIELNLALLYGMQGDLFKSAEICKKYMSKDQKEKHLIFYSKISKNQQLATDYINENLGV